MSGTREHLVCAAVSFLTSPSVRDHPDDTKRRFLQSKGLTDDEMLAAFARSRMVKPSEPTTKAEFNKDFTMTLEDEGQLINSPVPKRPSPPVLLVAFGVGVVGGVVYYLYKAFRRYIWPWVLKKWAEYRAGPPKAGSSAPPGVSAEGGELRELITCNMLELQDTVTSLKTILDKQQEDIKDIVSKDPICSEMRDVKGELQNLKKLLLSAKQFSTPVSKASIPDWQIRKTVPSTSASATAKEDVSRKSEPTTPPSEPNTPPNGPANTGSTRQNSSSDISIVNWDSSTSNEASPKAKNTILESDQNSSSSSNSHSPIEVISHQLSENSKNDSMSHSSEEEEEGEEEEKTLSEEGGDE